MHHAPSTDEPAEWYSCKRFGLVSTIITQPKALIPTSRADEVDNAASEELNAHGECEVPHVEAFVAMPS
jgi:hypothetical protein